MLTKGGQGRLKINIFLIRSFKLSEYFKSEFQGVLEIFEEVYRGGGGGQSPTTLPPHRWELGYGTL